MKRCIYLKNCIYYRYRHIPQDVRSKIRKEVEGGRTKWDTALKFSISYQKVRRITQDLKSVRPSEIDKLSDEDINEIREYYKKVKNKKKTAQYFNLSYPLIKKITNDLHFKPVLDKTICDRRIEMLNRIMMDGYVFKSPNYTTEDFRSLKKMFPMIQRVFMNMKAIYFLENRSEDAAKAFIKSLNRVTISYNELNQIINTFDQSLLIKKKKEMNHFKKSL